MNAMKDASRVATEFEEAQAAAVAAAKRAEELRAAGRGAVIADIKRYMNLFGITAAELGFIDPAQTGKRGEAAVYGSDRRSIVQAKFRGPNGQTWAGRGNPPQWVRQHIDGGGSLDDLRIDTKQEEQKESA